jgi:phosphoglycerate dehydrogenase-like enzyme
MDINNILVVMPAYKEHEQQLQAAAPGAKVSKVKPENLTAELVQEADVILGGLPPAFLPHMKKAKLLQLNFAGVAPPYLALKDSHPDTVLCCASGAYGPAISEHMVAMLLSLMKRLHQYRDDQEQAAWIDRGDVHSIRGAKVLVVGLGDIGRCFARLCAAFGAEVIGIKRRAGVPPECVSRVGTMAELDSLLPWADVVALSLPETPDTIHLMDSKRLALMKAGSFLLNVGRGSAIDQEALLKALRSGHLAGAGIDVTDPEPLPKDHPLWQEPNLVLTPHVSGLYHLRLTLDLIIDIACKNIKALPDGPFISKVDFRSGYRE